LDASGGSVDARIRPALFRVWPGRHLRIDHAIVSPSQRSGARLQISRVRERNAHARVISRRDAAKNALFPRERNESAEDFSSVVRAHAFRCRCLIPHLRKAACTRSGQLSLPRAAA